MSASSSWKALRDALAVHEPSCTGDERFTAETGEHDAALRKICAACPVQQQCFEYAKAEHRHRVWGVYGGIIRRTTPQIRERQSAKTPRSSVYQLAS